MLLAQHLKISIADYLNGELISAIKNDKERYYKQFSKLIIEVLSSSTQPYDRSEKFHNYRQLNSLEEYVLISQDKQQIEIYRRCNHWQASIYIENNDFQF
jgi:Uma2 family endonuclease